MHPLTMCHVPTLHCGGRGVAVSKMFKPPMTNGDCSHSAPIYICISAKSSVQCILQLHLNACLMYCGKFMLCFSVLP